MAVGTQEKKGYKSVWIHFITFVKKSLPLKVSYQFVPPHTNAHCAIVSNHSCKQKHDLMDS